jgi:ribonuclease P protein component
MVVVVCSNEIEALRIGVVAGRVVGNAVQRNRAKRLLRQAIRPYLTLIPHGWDILLIARQPLAAATFARVQEVLAELLRRSKVLQLEGWRSNDQLESHELNNG